MAFRVVQVGLLAAVACTLPSTGRAAAAPKDAPGEWKQKTNEEGKVVQELKIEAPAMTEEDQYGYVMPERYRCDSCKAVMFHLNQELYRRHPKSRRMKQWEYTDAFDDICRTSFQGYGIKLIDGENALSGPGLKENEAKIAPGSGAIQMGGESWTKRLTEICKKIVYEQVGEDELYDKFYTKFKAEADESDNVAAGEGISEALCIKETKDCKSGPRAPPRPRPRETEDKADKKKKDKAKDKKDDKKNKKDEKPKKVMKIPIEEVGDKKAKSASTATASTSERMDVQTFLRTLAIKHGLDDNEYLTARTEREWEKLTLAMGGRIFARQAESDEGSCKAS